MGPLLFSIYIIDLPLICRNYSVQLYADDTAVYTSANPNCPSVGLHLNKLAIYCTTILCNDGAYLHRVGQTKYMCFMS